MTPKLVIYALAVISIAGMLAGAHYIEGNYWRNKLLAERPDTTISRLPEIRSKMPAETLSTKSHPALQSTRKNPSTGLITPNTLKSDLQTDSLRAIIEDLLIPRQAELVTSQGETIEVTYDARTDTFTVIPTSVVIIRPQETLIAHNIPAVEPPTKNMWLTVNALNAQGAAVLGTIGYKQVGITVGLVQEKMAWGIGLHFSL